ncbi:hypothetical protein EUX98_g467 [Antrodiella citrinella]|uniref:Nucleolar protein 9 n=1 Tax=Antrodiella citrinella TaxID=2447956 RepID=A0A4S4N762_9APHY|nr:hypothetical protein EUX98_g467 [Antrodiella citrinella]
MPRENRKRGKKHKKFAAEETYLQEEGQVPEPEPEAGPSWITRAPERSAQEDREAPFGYVDAEVKAYFRTVDLQIREWQEEHEYTEEQGDSDPNEDRRLFFVAALDEMSDKEKQLATDPDCSGILERMTYSMDDFARRVFVDRLSGLYEQLLRHRFASHVCQTLITVAGDTISRECRGIMSSSPKSDGAGELRTLSQLVLDICEEITPLFSSLITDCFASHVIRALLSLLVPGLSSEQANSHKASNIRSKKSASFKAKQGPLKSVFSSAEPEATAGEILRPEEFPAAAKRFVNTVREKLDANEVRALAANQVASPVLQLLLEVEAGANMADEPGSLMDSVLAGLITTLHSDEDATAEASDYVVTLLRDPTSSHLLETLVSRSSERVFDIMWQTYFEGKLARLAVHPVANFVVAKALARLNVVQLNGVCQELNSVSAKILKAARIGIFRAMIERATALRQEESTVLETVYSAFELNGEDRTKLVPCVLRLLPLNEYANLQSREGNQDSDQAPHGHRSQKKLDDPLEPKTQGALLLQSLLSLPAPHNQVVVDSVLSHSIDELLVMSQHVTSSRVYDALLDFPTVPLKAKRQLVLKFMGHFHTLVDDRIGSRVGDRCWASADPYLKEKIARSLIVHEQDLAASFYGKFFARRLNLQLLRKDTEKWKSLQSTSKPTPAVAPPAQNPVHSNGSQPAADSRKSSKRKRAEQPEDEIDQLFSTALGTKIKKAELVSEAKALETPPAEDASDKKGKKKPRHDDGLDNVLGAIKDAPKSEGRPKKKKVAK